MNLHRLNHKTFEPQIFTEESKHKDKHTLNLSEFSQTYNMSNKIDKFHPHTTRVICTESYKVFLALKTFMLAYPLKNEPW